jgi:hypothetical protein
MASICRKEQQISEAAYQALYNVFYHVDRLYIMLFMFYQEGK